MMSREDERQAIKDMQKLEESKKKQAIEKQKQEEKEIVAQIGELKFIIAKLNEKTKKGEDIRYWFKLFDADKNKNLTMDEVVAVLRHAGVNQSEKEMKRVFKLMDRDNNGSVSYQEFCDIIQGIKVPDYHSFVVKERAAAKQEAEDEFINDVKKANIKSDGAYIGSSEASRDENIGHVEGLSKVMARSIADENKEKILLVDPEDFTRAKQKIRQLITEATPGKPTTFEEIMQLLGKGKF